MLNAGITADTLAANTDGVVKQVVLPTHLAQVIPLRRCITRSRRPPPVNAWCQLGAGMVLACVGSAAALKIADALANKLEAVRRPM